MNMCADSIFNPGERMKPRSIEAGDPVVTRLQALARERPDLKDAARIYEAVLPLLRDIDLHVAPVSLTLEEAREKLEKGFPLLSGLDLELDENAVYHLALRLARSIESIQNPSESDISKSSEGVCKDGDTMLPGAARRIRLALEENTMDFSALLAHSAADEPGSVESLARELCLDPGLLRMLVRNALKPALGAWRRQLVPHTEGIRWDRGYCFLCGAEATLGELRDNMQVLHLRCAQCGADWQARRLRCVWCGNEDHETLGCLYNEDQREKMRVEVCDTCRGYLKVISFFSPTPPEMLPVEDLATLHLDYIAQARGYRKT
jgi:FdhE protein